MLRGVKMTIREFQKILSFNCKKFYHRKEEKNLISDVEFLEFLDIREKYVDDCVTYFSELSINQLILFQEKYMFEKNKSFEKFALMQAKELSTCIQCEERFLDLNLDIDLKIRS